MSTLLLGKTILMIIAFDRFRDEELLVPHAEFVKNKGQVTVASLQKGDAKGQLGAKFKVDLTLEEVDPSKYDAIIFVGGQGTPSVRASEKALEIAKKTPPDKVLAAICWAPTILAKAGMLESRRATVWVGDDPEYKKTTPQVLEGYKAIFVNEDVVVDGRLITANGAPAALKFARAIIEKLSKRN